MKRYVIFLCESDSKVYVKVEPNGRPYAVSSISEATAFPSKMIASAIVNAIKPAIKKNSLSVDIGVESF